MTDAVTPLETPGPTFGERALDVLWGLGAMILLIPALPILVLIWLYSKLRRPTDEKLRWKRR